MDSRLDRLFILLDTGSNESVRIAAAKQLGEVQRVQPNDLNYLLQRIKEYSGKSVWETRVAAGHATRCVLEQVAPWPESDVSQQQECGVVDGKDSNVGEDDKFRCRREIAERIIEQNSDTQEILEQFDLEKIISTCPKLLSLDVTNSEELIGNASSSKGSRGGGAGKRGVRKESSSRGSSSKNDKEQLMRQRKLINKELGIAMVDSLNLGVKSTDIVSNDDLQTDYEIESELTSKSTTHPASLIGSNYDRVVDLVSRESCISMIPLNDALKEKPLNNQAQLGDISTTSMSDLWPLTEITKQYTKDLFNPSWEARHGAAVAMREIVRLQGKFAGRILNFTKDSNDRLNQLWLVDMALKSLSVLALDKFGDFLFDQVVAPVRENAAQLLGCCIANMSEINARSTIKIVLKMLNSPNWESRHGGILGLKYSLNIGNDHFSKMILQESFDLIFKCLADPVDDVSAEAAAALVPVKDLMIKTVPEKAPQLIKFLWDHLSDLDELTTSTSNIVLLLASLITSNSAQLETTELIKSIPRLWSLLGHSSTSVRMSALKAIKTLLEAQKSNCLDWMPENLITTALRLIFQRSILENMDEVRSHIEDVWLLLIRIDTAPGKSHTERFKLLKSTSDYLNHWLCLVMHPANVPIDRNSMWLNIGPDGSISSTKPEGEVYIGSHSFNADNSSQQKSQITKCRLVGIRLLGALYANLVNDFSSSEQSKHFKETLNYLSEMFGYYITTTNSANQRIFCGWILESWACEQNLLLAGNHELLKKVLPTNLTNQINSAIQECSIWYDELASTYTRLQHETRDFVGALKEANMLVPNLAKEHQVDVKAADKKTIYKLSQIEALCGLSLEDEFSRANAKKAQNSVSKSKLDDIMTNTLSMKKANLIKSYRSTKASHKMLSTSVLSSLACAQISWRLLPELTDVRLKIIIQPLIGCIENEEEQSLQDKSIKYLVTLVDILCKDNSAHQNVIEEEILSRLMKVLSTKALSLIFEPDETILNCINPVEWSPPEKSRRIFIEAHKIVLLDDLQRKAELSRISSRRQSSINSVPSLKRSHSLTTSLDIDNSSMIAQEESDRSHYASFEVSEIKLRGSRVTLKKLISHFGVELPAKLPKLWQALTDDIKKESDIHRKNICEKTAEEGNEIRLVKSLRLLEVAGDSLHANLRSHLLELFSNLVFLLASSSPVIRHLSAQCIGVIIKLMFSNTMKLIQEKIIPMLDHSDNVISRCGAIEAIAFIIEYLQLDLVPHINIFIVHVLKRMSDQNDQVRLMATHCFGKLLSLMPLNLNDKSKNQDKKPNINELLINKKQDEKTFIEQLLDPKKLDNFVIPFSMQTELRSYQQDGLNWLAFLNRFNLHGILCDEMGLGKTLMTICMVASDHFLSKQTINLAKNDDSKGHVTASSSSKCPPSLIVCPSTLTEHWLYEIEKFLPADVKKALNPVAYFGVLNDRMNLRCQILQAVNGRENDLYLKASVQTTPINLVVASYDIVRNDIDFFREIHWNYCVLDEGHIIKNGKTKLSRAIRMLNAKHRLILSGTPIQNNVTELWSLFDYLMPGFLGSERQFNSRYTKPILQSREVKCSTRDMEAGALAMESLHRQVLPFILRRLKEDVLDDLPPKIIQDYFCELSPLQHKLYEDFTRSKLCKNVTKKSITTLADDGRDDKAEEEANKTSSKSHVFQALQYLKNVCNHPKLVLTDKHSQYSDIKKSLDSEKSSLDDIAHSSKLKALKQLLIDCGIGAANQSNEEQQSQQQQQALTIQSVVNQHRALIFCQIRSMVEIIENDLLKRHLPTITYLKLDGSIPSNQRHSIVSRFNNDPSIDILLLTTQIGGLGLNLTGADTVIFVEHDWNPTKDLQAMDRAHRIGQKKVVNVYRLITKGTLEEKIMGLQKFKTMVSNTVINQDNAGLGTMNVDQLFDLFEDTTARTTTISGDRRRGEESGKCSSSKSFMDLLPELWDQQQYETEYDLSNFVSSLKN